MQTGSTETYFVGIDIGGTWIKGCLLAENQINSFKRSFLDEVKTTRVKSPLNSSSTKEELLEAIDELISAILPGKSAIKGIGISTAGIVNYAGTKVLKAAAHLTALKDESWIKELEARYNCAAILINDADAATIGIAEKGFLKGNKAVGIMPVGTGLGFTVWKNGRRWRLGKMLNLLGSIRTPAGFYDSIASASQLAGQHPQHELQEVLIHPNFETVRNTYIDNLTEIINTAAIIYNLDEVLVCGGLADAAIECSFPLEEKLNSILQHTPVELNKAVKVKILPNGNSYQLIGALWLAIGEATAKNKRITPQYTEIKTEVPYNKENRLEQLSTSDLVSTLLKAEQEAGSQLEKSVSYIEKVVDKTVERLQKGGRIIYVGAGTSGRIASMDAVEIPCTYGFPEDKILSIVAGGIADAAIEIESDFEEDASAVPEMLLLNIQPEDVVIGISASGTAYYVQSALAFAKERGAYSVLLQSMLPEASHPFCDITIPMNSGYEVVAGSTRMKAGTATKRILNFISSSVMIKMGKVAGSYMVDVACINKKLIERAQDILGKLYALEKDEAIEKLQKHNLQLSSVIEEITKSTGN